jgi:hypothetical protein
VARVKTSSTEKTVTTLSVAARKTTASTGATEPT